MKVKEVFDKSFQFLKDRKIESPRLGTELLLASVLKTDRVGIYLKYDAPLDKQEIDRLRDLIVRKSKGEPTAYLLGEKYFYNRSFLVGPGVLIPRPETEQIIELALDDLRLKKENFGFDHSVTVADLGCGSGCLGLTLGLELLKANSASPFKIYLIEKSLEAMAFAEKNRAQLVSSDYLHQFETVLTGVEDWAPNQCFDLIIANPPYIAADDLDVSDTVKRFEPHMALFADDEGLYCIKTWLNRLVPFLKPQAEVLFEIGHRQGSLVKELFEETKIFDSVEIIRDFNKKDRIIKAVKNG